MPVSLMSASTSTNEIRLCRNRRGDPTVLVNPSARGISSDVMAISCYDYDNMVLYSLLGSAAAVVCRWDFFRVGRLR